MDGSGLSRLNRMAPEQLVALMKRVAQQEYGEAFFRCFPRGGGAELPGHFQWSPASQSLGTRVCAVDGFLPGTHSLAGWTVTAGGRKVYFAFMVNGAALPKSQAREWLDRMALAIAQSPLRENL